CLIQRSPGIVSVSTNKSRPIGEARRSRRTSTACERHTPGGRCRAFASGKNAVYSRPRSHAAFAMMLSPSGSVSSNLVMIAVRDEDAQHDGVVLLHGHGRRT